MVTICNGAKLEYSPTGQLDDHNMFAALEQEGAEGRETLAEWEIPQLIGEAAPWHLSSQAQPELEPGGDRLRALPRPRRDGASVREVEPEPAHPQPGDQPLPVDHDDAPPLALRHLLHL